MRDGMPVLVLGGAGYIGSHVSCALHDQGYRPVVYDNLSAGSAGFVQWGPLVQGDVRDRALLTSVIKTHGIRAVIHLAAAIEVGESVINPLKYYANNVASSIVLAEVLRDCGVEALIFSSTAAVYGEPQRLPLDEDHPKLPVNPYGASKGMAETIFRDSHRAGGVPCVPLRYFNACGADPLGRIGEAHQPETHLIPRACLAALGRGPALQVFGSDFDTPDGTALRDYVHVCDLADAHIRALRYVLQGGQPCPFNLGMGAGISVMEIIKALESAAGRPVPYLTKPRRTGDPARLIANIDRAKNLLGWQPLYKNVGEIIQTAWNWHSRD